MNWSIRKLSNIPIQMKQWSTSRSRSFFCFNYTAIACNYTGKFSCHLGRSLTDLPWYYWKKNFFLWNFPQLYLFYNFKSHFNFHTRFDFNFKWASVNVLTFLKLFTSKWVWKLGFSVSVVFFAKKLILQCFKVLLENLWLRQI